MSRPLIALTQGDPAGIGPEILLKVSRPLIALTQGDPAGIGPETCST